MSLGHRLFFHPTMFRRIMNLYPPFVGAGVRIVRVTADFSEVVAELRAKRLNRNVFGTHFGGSLYSMTDPFFALMMAAKLGSDYEVWDKSATIDFVRPGTGTVSARFVLSAEQVEEARNAVATAGKFEPTYKVEVTNAAGKVVARVSKTLHVRRKPEARTAK